MRHQPTSFYSKSLIVNEGQALSEDAINKWFKYMADTNKGPSVQTFFGDNSMSLF
jgi:hypothetical protein